MNILNARQLSKTFGPRVLFQDASIVVDDGEKVGVIGVNGSGKSTLFKILASEVEPDEGIIALRKGATVGYLSQAPKFPKGSTPRTIVAQVMGPVRESIERWTELSTEIVDASPEQQQEMLDEQAELQRLIDRSGGWAWEHHVEGILERLGLSDAIDNDISTLSGGQNRRVALAQILLSSPDLMILDEPTNHLDADTVEWLEGVLKAHHGAILMVTHDRYFLDHIVTRIVEFDHIAQELVSHPGNYQAYMNNKIERMLLRERTEDKRLNLLRTELEWLRRAPKARGTKAKARIQRAETLKVAGPSAHEKSISMNFTADHKLVGKVLEVENVEKSYDEELLKEINLLIQRGEKLGLVGPNGSGKSTLIRMLMGTESPDSGTIEWGKNARPGLLDQARSGLDPEKTVLDALGEADMLDVGERRVHKRTYLREFLFERDEQLKKVGALSGGEICRLLMAQLILKGSNFLILDEPTNDLDISSLQILEQSLRSFKGCVLLVTHDRYFINKVCDTILAIEDNTIVRYDGDYDFYRKRRNERERLAKANAQETQRQQTAAQPKPEEKAPNKPKKLTWKEQRELEEIEGVILEAEEARDSLETQLADPELYRKNPSKVPTLTSGLEEANTRVDALYARWEELESRA